MANSQVTLLEPCARYQVRVNSNYEFLVSKHSVGIQINVQIIYGNISHTFRHCQYYSEKRNQDCNFHGKEAVAIQTSYTEIDLYLISFR